MGYASIDNLYRPQAQGILSVGDLYALEKIDGTSAHLAWKDGALRLFAGGAKHETFVALFDQPSLAQRFETLGHSSIVVYGEAYGGKLQGMSKTYGDRLRFVVFDVRVGEDVVGPHRRGWLDVPAAECVAGLLGLEFVHYRRISPTLEAIDAERDAPSEQAKRNGIIEPKIREGIVLRPLVETHDARGNRLIAKHKRPEFSETRTPREVDPAARAAMLDAERIADEYVTERRMDHVVDKQRAAGVPCEGVADTSIVIRAMLADVKREAGEEVEWSKVAERAVCTAAARLYKARVTTIPAEQVS